jgi:uncharacterized repeat protein (TIGR03803 family)
VVTLSLNGAGNLYSTTRTGGAYFCGTVVELAKGTARIKTLATLTGSNDGGPSGLVIDSAGNLYGTTNGSAFNGYTSTLGSVFELAKGSRTIRSLATFGCLEAPSALIIDGSGNLFGTTANAGASSEGDIFELAKNSGTITVLASFDGLDGAKPNGGLTMDAKGNLYGTTESGGSVGDGTVFEMTLVGASIERGMSGGFVMNTSQPLDAAVVPDSAVTKGPSAHFEADMAASQDMGGKKVMAVSVLPLKSNAPMQELALRIAEIDQLFAGKWLGINPDGSTQAF